MGVYDRNKGVPGTKPNYWINYRITEELRIKHGLSSRNARESAGGSVRAAQALLALRNREVKDGTWRPAAEGSARGLTLQAYALEWLARREEFGVRGVRDEAQRLRDYVLPVLGDRPLTEIRRAEVKDLIGSLQGRVSKRTGRPLAPRVVIHIYGVLRTLYADAVADDKVVASPCTLRVKRGELPKKKDANPRFRSEAIFARDEVEMLISDERVPPQRRMLYALTFFGGMRIGEAVARKWRDYDPRARPLGRMIIATQHEGRDLKTEEPRDMPVHPALAAMLAEWKLSTFEMLYQRKPERDEYIVPNLIVGARGKHAFISGKRAWQNLQNDLDTLGLRRRRVHDTRRTFISLATGDGADKYLLKFVTHGRPKSDAFDDYVSPPWPSLCEQVAKLQVGPNGAPDNVRPLKRTGG